MCVLFAGDVGDTCEGRIQVECQETNCASPWQHQLSYQYVDLGIVRRSFRMMELKHQILYHQF